MIFEMSDVQVIAPLDPWEGDWYVELVKGVLSREELDNIYNVISYR